ncbi:MAG: AAA family ATPase [Actinobacteria bacterium]|nr:AAA family ATPase [Actinomycetota bacterium]
MSDLKNRLLSFIEREREETWSQVRRLYALPPEKRVEEGECIVGLRLVEVVEDEVVFRVEENLSRFRSGDPLYLGDGKNITSGIKCVFSDYDPVEKLVRVSFAWSGSAAAASLSKRKEYVLDRRVIDNFSQRTRAVEEVFGRGRFADAGKVIGLEAKPCRVAGERRARSLVRGLELNPSQEEAFIHGYCSSPVLIQGPPGTGKTWLLAELAGTLMEKDVCRVLVCCFTHRAINNALNKIVALGYGNVFKVSSPHHVDDLDKRVLWAQNWRLLPIEGDRFIVGATPYGAFRMAGEVPFDAVIFDEAGQLTLDLALMGMCCAGRWVFIGDHMQLAPVLAAEHDDELVRRSAFEHLFRGYPSVMLEITYRMNEDLCRFPSECFYGGRLRPSEKARLRKLPQGKGAAFADILDPHAPSVFVEVNHRGMTMRSPEEAKLVAHLVTELVSGYGIPPEEIAVVTPFRAQAAEIRVQLARLAARKKIKVGGGLVVDTVERIQGQEREVVLISFACSDTRFLRNKLDFFFKPNRLNVSITRARVKRIMVGSRHLLGIRPRDETARAMVEVLRRLYRQTPRLDYTERIRELQ